MLFKGTFYSLSEQVCPLKTYKFKMTNLKLKWCRGNSIKLDGCVARSLRKSVVYLWHVLGILRLSVKALTWFLFDSRATILFLLIKSEKKIINYWLLLQLLLTSIDINWNMNWTIHSVAATTKNYTKCNMRMHCTHLKVAKHRFIA